MNDQTIVDTLIGDEEQGYTMLIDTYAPYVAAIVSGVAKGALPAGDLEELAADVFFRVWQKREGLQSATLKAYIAQTARNAAIDQLRKARLDFLPYEDDVLWVDHSHQPDQLALAREQTQVVAQLVDSLEEPEREIFIRFYYFGERVKAISQRLQLNAATVKTKLHRTRGTLKGILQERGYGCE